MAYGVNSTQHVHHSFATRMVKPNSLTYLLTYFITNDDGRPYRPQTKMPQLNRPRAESILAT